MSIEDPVVVEPTREIVAEFAAEIAKRARDGAKPEFAIIEFRNEMSHKFERQIKLVPIELLRFRKDNGRIASDVYSYEIAHGTFDERSPDGQKVLKGFLQNIDKEANKVLYENIRHHGQSQPAIITSDGFLINGNRRKLTLELLTKNIGNEFREMKVVILPGKDDPGGPPTLREIEEIENRYQLQQEGKSEYTGYNKALSIRLKESKGMSLEDQLRDDPSIGTLSDKEFQKVVKRYRDEFLGPLECVDEYLRSLGREGLYESVFSVGRWQSFIDYYKSVCEPLMDDNFRARNAIEDREIGQIKQAAFNIIRCTSRLADSKNHEIMRKLKKLISDRKARKEIIKIDHQSDPLSASETSPTDTFADLDSKWTHKNLEKIDKQLRTAIQIVEHNRVKETPLTLLKDALKKLRHEEMDLETVKIDMLPTAIQIANEVAEEASALAKKGLELHKENSKFLPKTN